MEDLLKWVAENWLVVTGLVVLAGNLLNGVLRLIPGNQGEEEGGWLHGTLKFLRGLLDRSSVLSAKDGAGTVKLPLAKSKTE